MHLVRPDWLLLEPLRASIRFLQHFAHPDGSFGGLYGSRCTRFYFPAGVLALAEAIPEAAALASAMEVAIDQQRTVTLSAMDEPNLIPMFNAYAWAAVQHQQRPQPSDCPIPASVATSFRRWYPQAGLLVDRGPTHYSIISTHKGGVVYHFAEQQLTPLIDAGIVIRDPCGRLGSTQGFNPDNLVDQFEGKLRITAPVTGMPKQHPGPKQFLVIRLLSLTAFQTSILREWIKRRLVSLLITRKQTWPITNQRQIRLGKHLAIEDRPTFAPGYRQEPKPGEFVSIHMASQGYWQIQDEQRA